MTHSFPLDRRNGKIMGVCAGLSARTGLDVTLIRLSLVLLTFCALGPIGVVAYLLAGWLGGWRKDKRTFLAMKAGKYKVDEK